MAKHQARSAGFVLIAALLLLFLLSGIAVGVMMLTNSEVRIGGNDKESNMVYFGAESGMEKITSDLAALYQQKQAPSPADIQNLTNYPPDSTMVGSTTYSPQETITYPTGALTTTPQVISSGSNEGLTAFLTRMDVTVNALRPSGAAATITRGVEVAQIPVFQFGVFSDSDLSYFAGPYFAFAGRVHTNGNLFPTPGSNLVFGAKITVVGEIVRDFMSNSLPVGGSYNGNVYAPKVANACDPAIQGSRVPNYSNAPELNCVAFTRAMESWVNATAPGLPPGGASSSSPDWIYTTAPGTFNHNVVNGRSDGVKKLVLPFVQPGVSQIEIVRKPQALELASSALGASRLYNQANIRVLLADTLANLHPAPYDANDVDLGVASLATYTANAGSAAFGGDAVAYADPGVDGNWVTPTPGVAGTKFPLLTGVLRVEYQNAAGNWVGVTSEWLGLGIGRGLVPPTSPNVVGSVDPKAILRLQELADPNMTGTVPAARNDVTKATNWYPINFYDPREGGVRDVTLLTTTQCNVNGIMNAVEIDAGNLKGWLGGGTIAGGAAGSGLLVSSANVNGYLLYFSDRRGMAPDPRSTPVANQLTGEYGFEDVVNVATSATGAPNGVDGGAAETGEDVDGNGVLDTWGAANVGNGFGVATAGNPYISVSCPTVGRANRVTGARHVLRLIDGGLGKLPLPQGATGLNGGGFTVASENPVYVLGDYNSDSATNPPWADANHAAAGILADAVTLLSNPVGWNGPCTNTAALPAAGEPTGWNDEKDMCYPTALTNRNATTTSYRVAIAAGKSLTFPNPTGANSNDWGTDGGVHNFLRYIEDWSGQNLWYEGSIVSLYTSQYATGTFKCCATVYSPPGRNYSFDSLFLNPADLPPGTPRFTDIVNLTYRQDFTPN